MKLRNITVTCLALLLMTGCANSSKSFDAVMNSALSSPLPIAANHSKNLYRYYVPPSVGVKSSNQNSTLFNIDNNEVMMNLNISQIVSSKYYEEGELEERNLTSLDFENILYSYSGSYFDTYSISRKLDVYVLRMSDDRVALLANNRLIDMIAVIPEASLPQVLESVLTILRSVEVDETRVVAAYSTKEIIDRDAIYSQFFEQVPPENGTLQDMYDRLNPTKQD